MKNAERLQRTLKESGSTEQALKAMLCSELMVMFRQYMNVEKVDVCFEQDGISVKVAGDGIKRVGHTL